MRYSINWDLYDDFDIFKGGKANAKLIPVKKMIYKDGKSYMQTFWLLPDEIQGNKPAVHEHLKEHLRYVRKTAGSDKYREHLKNSGVKWDEHENSQVNTMKATQAAIEHLKNGGTIKHTDENGDEHHVIGKHQSEHAMDEHKAENEEKGYHIFVNGQGFQPIKGNPVHLEDGVDTFIHPTKDGKYAISEGYTGAKLTVGYQTKEEAIAVAKKKIEQMGGADAFKNKIKDIVAKNGISPSHAHKYDEVMGDDQNGKPTVPASQEEPKEEPKKPEVKVPAKPEKEPEKPVEEPEGATAKDMNGETVKVGDTVKDANGKNFIITKIEGDKVYGKRIGKGKENAGEKLIKNEFKKFTPTKGAPSVPAKPEPKPEEKPKPKDAKPVVPAKDEPESHVTHEELKALANKLKGVSGFPPELQDKILQEIFQNGFSMKTKDMVEGWEKEEKISHDISYAVGPIVSQAAKQHNYEKTHAEEVAKQKKEQQEKEAKQKGIQEQYGENSLSNEESKSLSNYFQAWFSSSTSKKGNTLRAVMVALGLAPKETMNAVYQYQSKGDMAKVKSIRNSIADNMNDTIKSAVNKLYKQTQIDLKNIKGAPKTVVLYRGVQLDYEVIQKIKNGETVHYSPSSLESWTTNAHTGSNFGSQIVMRMEFPIEQILTNHHKTYSHHNEYEWFPLPTTDKYELKLGENCHLGSMPENLKEQDKKHNSKFTKESHYPKAYPEGYNHYN